MSGQIVTLKGIK